MRRRSHHHANLSRHDPEGGIMTTRAILGLSAARQVPAVSLFQPANPHFDEPEYFRSGLARNGAFCYRPGDRCRRFLLMRSTTHLFRQTNRMRV
jgi:hypothetical protein